MPFSNGFSLIQRDLTRIPFARERIRM